MKSKQSFLQRILRVEKFYLHRGINKESVNDLKRKILAQKFNKLCTPTNKSLN